MIVANNTIFCISRIDIIPNGVYRRPAGSFWKLGTQSLYHLGLYNPKGAARLHNELIRKLHDAL